MNGINGITRWLNETQSSRDSDRRDVVVVKSKKINSDEEGGDGGRGYWGTHKTGARATKRERNRHGEIAKFSSSLVPRD